MRVIKEGAVVDNGWTLHREGDVPDAGDVIVPLALYLEHKEQLLARSGRTAVCLPSDLPHEQAASVTDRPLLAIEFPKFGDGRGYSLARLLRQRHGYQGELLAVGDVLRDQLFYMARCGITSFAVKEGKDIEGAVAGLSDFSVTYQAAADDPRPLYRRVTR